MEKIILEQCPICDQGKWRYINEVRNAEYWFDKEYIYDQPIGFKICKECGFVTYDYETDEELKRRYEEERNIINFNCIVTANRKLTYHRKFLEYIDLKDKDVLDYGCGVGMFLKMCREEKQARVMGMELNKIQTDYMFEEYKIPAVNNILDLEKSTFDLICCYHVLEHVQNPDRLLKDFQNRLNENGYLYVSVPQNFGKIFDEASGMITNNFENYYHLNHVNLFSKNSLKNILAKYGFKIVKEDELMYGYTVLCQKTDQKIPIIKDEYLSIVAEIEKQKKAIEFYQAEQWEEAIKCHETYIDAWSMHAVKDFKDLKKQETRLIEAMGKTDNYYKIKRQLAYLYFQWDQKKAGEGLTPATITNHTRNSKKLFEELVEERPGMEDFHYYLGVIEAKYYKNYEKAREYFQIVIDINPAKYSEMMNLVGWLWKEKYK